MDNDIRGRYRGYQGRSQPRPRTTSRQVASAPKKTTITKSPQARPSAPANHSADPLDEITNIYKNHNDQQTYAPPKKNKKKNKSGKAKAFFITLFILALIGGLAYGGYWYATKNNTTNNATNPFALGAGQKTAPAGSNAQPVENSAPANQNTKETIRFVATGDMIAHDSVNANAKKSDGTYDYAALMSGTKPYFDKSDISFCNQSTPAGGDAFGITGYPIFNAPIEFARGIEAIGCNLINIGTNHTNDKGQDLVNATVASWDDREVLAVTGANRTQAEQDSIEYFEVEGLKFAFMNYMTYNNSTASDFGVNMYNAGFAQTQITEARKSADFVIVSMRWGTEYSPDLNSQQDTIAQELANFGADVVLGHGPHVLQPVKKLSGLEGRDTLVWYSLGNFLNTQLDAESLVGGFAIMDINVKDKTISAPSFMPVYMHYDWTAAEKASQSLLARNNLQMVPLDTAADLLAKSQLGTTVEAQTSHLTAVLNKFTPVKIIKSTEF